MTYVNAAGAAGINVNGIVATSDGRYLIIGKRNENMLFRVDLKSREIVPVNMPAGMLDTPDGLFLEGNILYVTQNLPKSVAVVKLSSDFSQAELERTINHPTCHSGALKGDGVSLTNAQNGVNFDINSDGQTERLAWTTTGADDAFLALVAMPMAP